MPEAICRHPKMDVRAAIDAFAWQPGVTPLSTTRSILVSCSGYLLTIWALRKLIKQPTRLTRLVPALHNTTLCLGSLAMFLGALSEVVQDVLTVLTQEVRRRRSYNWLVCLPPGTRMQGGLYFWSYVYYLSKYYEFFDTLLLVLKAKPLSFLHVFHHATVVPMAFLWLAGAQSLQHVALLTNTAVHVVMYYYYLLCSLGRGPDWKRVITNAQILQFVFSFAISIPFWWQHAKGRRCSGFGAMVFNAAFNFALLALFVNFHRRAYARKRATRAKQQ